jgi:hypothetical protein
VQVSDDEFWKIRWHDLEPGLLRKLGNGSYGQVFQGVYLNAQVAIKVLNIDYDDPAGATEQGCVGLLVIVHNTKCRQFCTSLRCSTRL